MALQKHKLEIFFLRTRRRSARHCIKLEGKWPEAKYKGETTRTQNGAHEHTPLLYLSPRPTSTAHPRLPLVEEQAQNHLRRGGLSVEHPRVPLEPQRPHDKHDKLEICHCNSFVPLSMPFSLLRSITVPKILVFQCVFQYSPYYPMPKFVQHI
jgi:hypothetical protein